MDDGLEDGNVTQRIRGQQQFPYGWYEWAGNTRLVRQGEWVDT